jgi:hypothetical protein
MPLDSQSHKSHRRNPTRRDALKTGSLGVLGLGLSTVRIPADQSAPPKLYLEAYTDRSSYEAGDDVSVHVSTNAARYAVEIASRHTRGLQCDPYVRTSRQVRITVRSHNPVDFGFLRKPARLDLVADGDAMARLQQFPQLLLQ